jgi:MoaA/NifB/PqqE/SkfB family radical SAM enzyme
MSPMGPPEGELPRSGFSAKASPVRQNRIDTLRAPLFVSWQLTRDCDLCCLHCCTDSAPGKRMHAELDADEAMAVADEIIRNEVPYVMLCGGEPLVVPHFLALAERLGGAGVRLKIETNGQRFDAATAMRLARLPIRSVQISLDGDTEDVYQAQRPGGSLAKAHAACRAVRDAGMPLEVTFAPTRLNIHQLRQVIERARALGAFRLNTGRLMRIGTAARLWDRLQPDAAQYRAFVRMLEEHAAFLEGQMELCYVPFSMAEGLQASLKEPPATLLLLPNGWVKVAAALPHICADLRRTSLQQAWKAYCDAWQDDALVADVRGALRDESRHAEANRWRLMSMAV